MKKSFFHFMILIMVFCLFPDLVKAKTGYVSDRLILNFRQGPDSASDVIKTLKSDTPVFILEEKNEFYKIELISKETGWVEKKFITFELPKTLVIDQLKLENKDLKDKIAQLSVLESGLKKIEGSLISDKEIKYNDLVEQSKNTAKIVKENQMYQKENMTLSQKIESLGKKNEDLLKTDMIKWFLSGAGVLILGWIIGLSVSSRKRKSNSLMLD